MCIRDRAETRGRVHEYLGITIDYSLPGKVVFTMFDFLEDVIVEHSKKFPVAWYCKLRNGYTPFLQEHYWYYLALTICSRCTRYSFCVQKKGNPALFRLKKLRV